jgi:hypothetical protein
MAKTPPRFMTVLTLDGPKRIPDPNYQQQAAGLLTADTTGYTADTSQLTADMTKLPGVTGSLSATEDADSASFTEQPKPRVRKAKSQQRKPKLDPAAAWLDAHYPDGAWKNILNKTLISEMAGDKITVSTRTMARLRKKMPNSEFGILGTK